MYGKEGFIDARQLKLFAKYTYTYLEICAFTRWLGDYNSSTAPW